MNPKFNAWDEETKHMYHAGDDHVVLDSDGTCYNLQTGNKLIPLFWTGKHDKKNNDLFHYDVVKRKFLSRDDPAYDFYFTVFQVEWANILASFVLLDIDTQEVHRMNEYNDLIKVGNILEQPELLDG